MKRLLLMVKMVGNGGKVQVFALKKRLNQLIATSMGKGLMEVGDGSLTRNNFVYFFGILTP